MAKSLKSKTSNTLIWILMGLLAISLIGFGTTSFTGGGQTVGAVGDQEISVNEYARSLDQGMANFQRQTGQRLTIEQAQLFGVSQRALGELFVAAALDNETNTIGFSAGDERLARMVQGLPGFRGIDGNFDRVVYEATLERSGMSVADFEDQLRDEMARSVLESAVASGIDVPRVATRSYLNFIATTRDVRYVILSESDLETAVAPASEAELQGYHNENKGDFMVPATKAITYAWLTPEMLAPSIEVEDAVLRTAYAARDAEFNTPERRLVERLVFGSDDDAAAASARLIAGEITFPDLVVERGLTLADVDLGDATQSELGAAGDAIFAMSETGVTQVLPSDLGPAIYRVNAILFAQATSFEEARDELANDYALDQARRLIGDISVGADDLLAGGADLEELAAETEMELGQIDFTGASDDGIAALGGFFTVAQALSVDDFPQIEQLDGGGVFAARLDEERATREMTFAEAREDVATAWRRQAVVAALTAQAEALATKLRGGAEITELGFDVGTSTGITRQASAQGLPDTALAEVFDLGLGEVRAIEAGDQVVLMQLDAETAPDITNEETAAQSRNVEQQLAQGIAGDMFQLYTNALQQEAGISLNQSMINAVHSQFSTGLPNANHP